jgi:4-hydroxythreonine-4-phosphate dehydrogenase
MIEDNSNHKFERQESEKPRIAISIGDLNGVGIEIALKSHHEISKICEPIYCINADLLAQAQDLLNIEVENFQISQHGGIFEIQPSQVTQESGKYSYDSFMKAFTLVLNKRADAIVTLPIHKEAWMLAGIEFKGHTDMLRKYLGRDAIMMLGCPEMFVALYTEHIPLKDVVNEIKSEKIYKFLIDFYNSREDNRNGQKIAVLGFNPHSGDNGVLGNEEKEIVSAIKKVNKELTQNIFEGPLVPDVAFTPDTRKKYKTYVAMYHDQGLTPLKALYFEKSINVSLNLPLVRTSVDHGTAFDIAYKNIAKNESYLNAVKEAISLI